MWLFWIGLIILALSLITSWIIIGAAANAVNVTNLVPSNSLPAFNVGLSSVMSIYWISFAIAEFFVVVGIVMMAIDFGMTTSECKHMHSRRRESSRIRSPPRSRPRSS